MMATITTTVVLLPRNMFSLVDLFHTFLCCLLAPPTSAICLEHSVDSFIRCSTSYRTLVSTHNCRSMPSCRIVRGRVCCNCLVFFRNCDTDSIQWKCGARSWLSMTSCSRLTVSAACCVRRFHGVESVWGTNWGFRKMHVRCKRSCRSEFHSLCHWPSSKSIRDRATAKSASVIQLCMYTVAHTRFCDKFLFDPLTRRHSRNLQCLISLNVWIVATAGESHTSYLDVMHKHSWPIVQSFQTHLGLAYNGLHFGSIAGHLYIL